MSLWLALSLFPSLSYCEKRIIITFSFINVSWIVHLFEHWIFFYDLCSQSVFAIPLRSFTSSSWLYCNVNYTFVLISCWPWHDGCLFKKTERFVYLYIILHIHMPWQKIWQSRTHNSSSTHKPCCSRFCWCMWVGCTNWAVAPWMYMWLKVSACMSLWI